MIDRYTLSKMGSIWTDEHKFQIMLKIEVLACEEMCKLGHIPKKLSKKSKKAPNLTSKRSKNSKNAPSMTSSPSLITSVRT
jgi:adenylosuccinate lyase